VVSASLLLDASRPLLHREMITKLEAEIAKASGADPVLQDLHVYQTTKNAEALRSLVQTLIQKKDYRGIAQYAEELFNFTGDPGDILAAAQASANVGDAQNFIKLVEAHPFLTERDASIARHYAWELFKTGRLKEAKGIADHVAKAQSAERDIKLEIAIAIECGEWEMLAEPLSLVARDASRFDPHTLIQSAYLAQVSGQGPLKDLVKASIERGGDDPQVLVGAYT